MCHGEPCHPEHVEGRTIDTFVERVALRSFDRLRTNSSG